jgi:hypothetical protein
MKNKSLSDVPQQYAAFKDLLRKVVKVEPKLVSALSPPVRVRRPLAVLPVNSAYLIVSNLRSSITLAF